MSKELQEILTQAVEDVKARYGRPVLARIAEITPFTVRQLQRLRDNGFVVKDNGNKGRHKSETKMARFLCMVDDEYLKQGITNSSVIFDRLRKNGYTGSLSTVKNYIKAHQDLVPAPRVLAIQTPNRGRRYETGPGGMFQMDWGFIKVEDDLGNIWQCACFAMVCHHCGLRYVEFFSSARQENLFIGMLHAFMLMGVPRVVLTDNMKSVTTRRLADGTPVWNTEYEAFQKLVGFRTRLCRIAHPFTKGQVERLVRYVKGNFVQGRRFSNITELNRSARDWCHEKNGLPTRNGSVVPMREHYGKETCGRLPGRDEILPYLAPVRKISYDGYVNYEDRLYGVPLSYSGKTVRVMRTGETLKVLNADTNEEVCTHRVDWSRKPKACAGQWSAEPEEQPTEKVTTLMRSEPPEAATKRFERFSLLDGGAQ